MSSEPQGYLSGKHLSNSDLKEHVAAFLQSTNMCVLATCSSNVPRATPLEYRSKGLTIYFVGEPGIKLKNIKDNPKVSIGVFLPYKGWNTAKGAQITGLAKIISRDDSAEFSEGLEAYKWKETAKELGIEGFPQTVVLVKVTPIKIEFIDATLKQSGYSPRQVLTL